MIKDLLHGTKKQSKPKIIMPVDEFNRWARDRYHKALDEYRMGLRHSLPIQSMFVFDKTNGFVLTNKQGIHQWYPTRADAQRTADEV